MKPKALPLVAFALFAASTVSAQVEPPAPAAPPALAAPAAPLRPSAAPAVPQAVAVFAPAVPAAPHAIAPPRPAVAPEQPAPPQEPTPAPAPPPAVAATTFFVSGNFLGVRTEEVTRENMQRYGLSGEPRGVGVREVVKNSPAEKAGLKANDVIVRFDGEPVTSMRKLTRLIQESAPDHSARVTVLRSGAEQELSATLTRREPFVSAADTSCSAPPRRTLMRAAWSGADSSMSRVSLRTLVTGSPSKRTITSLARRPAFSAGLPLTTSRTPTPRGSPDNP